MAAEAHEPVNALLSQAQTGSAACGAYVRFPRSWRPRWRRPRRAADAFPIFEAGRRSAPRSRRSLNFRLCLELIASISHHETQSWALEPGLVKDTRTQIGADFEDDDVGGVVVVGHGMLAWIVLPQTNILTLAMTIL